MRVLQVHKDFEPLGGGGGTARHIHGLARALAALDCEVRVVSPAPEAVADPYVTHAARPGELRPHIEWADVVHVHGARSTYAAAGAALSALSGRPFFYTPHAYYDGQTVANRAAKLVWDQTAERFMATRSAGMVLLTDVWRSFLRDRAISTGRTVIIPNCVLLADLAAPAAASGPAAPPPRIAGHPAILSVGRLDPVKRLRDVVSTLAEPGLEKRPFPHRRPRQRPRRDRGARAGAGGCRPRDAAWLCRRCRGDGDGGGRGRVRARVRTGGAADGAARNADRAAAGGVFVDPGQPRDRRCRGHHQPFPVGDITALARLLAAAPGVRVTDAQVAAIKRAFTWEERAADLLALYRSAARESFAVAA